MDQQVTITFPATPEYLRLARIATADAASRAGLDYEEIDDVRIAISELCSLLSGAPGGTITLGFAAGSGSLTVSGEAATPPGAKRNDDLSRTIIEAVVDEHTMVAEAGVTRFQVTKRSRVATR
jgi:serine/threonine-protein kinase RsbW